MKTTTLFAILVLFFASCTKPHDEMEHGVLIRVKNETTHKIIDVKVFSYTDAHSGDQEQGYGTINENSTSGYVSYGAVYNIPVLSYTISGAGQIDINRVRCANPPLSTLEAGRYTLIVSGDHISPEVTFVKD